METRQLRSRVAEEAARRQLDAAAAAQKEAGLASALTESHTRLTTTDALLTRALQDNAALREEGAALRAGLAEATSVAAGSRDAALAASSQSKDLLARTRDLEAALAEARQRGEAQVRDAQRAASDAEVATQAAQRRVEEERRARVTEVAAASRRVDQVVLELQEAGSARDRLREEVARVRDLADAERLRVVAREEELGHARREIAKWKSQVSEGACVGVRVRGCAWVCAWVCVGVCVGVRGCGCRCCDVMWCWCGVTYGEARVCGGGALPFFIPFMFFFFLLAPPFRASGTLMNVVCIVLCAVVAWRQSKVR